MNGNQQGCVPKIVSDCCTLPSVVAATSAGYGTAKIDKDPSPNVPARRPSLRGDNGCCARGWKRRHGRSRNVTVYQPRESRVMVMGTISILMLDQYRYIAPSRRAYDLSPVSLPTLCHSRLHHEL